MKVNIKVPVDEKNKLALKSNNIFNRIENMTPAELKNWIYNNVIDINDVRKVLTLLLIALKSK